MILEWFCTTSEHSRSTYPQFRHIKWFRRDLFRPRLSLINEAELNPCSLCYSHCYSLNFQGSQVVPRFKFTLFTPPSRPHLPICPPLPLYPVNVRDSSPNSKFQVLPLFSHSNKSSKPTHQSQLEKKVSLVYKLPFCIRYALDVPFFFLHGNLSCIYYWIPLLWASLLSLVLFYQPNKTSQPPVTNEFLPTETLTPPFSTFRNVNSIRFMTTTHYLYL